MDTVFDPSELYPLDLHLGEAWRAAALELGLSVTAPFELDVGHAVFRYGALVAGFGQPRGLLLRAMTDHSARDTCGAVWKEADKAGYQVAYLSPLLCRYDREEFVQFLDIFPWCGPSEERPLWYTGRWVPGQNTDTPK